MDKLIHIQEKGLDAVSWKTFIPADIIPDKRTIAIKYLDEIDRIDGLDPCDEECYIKAFNYRYTKLKSTLFILWRKFLNIKKEKRRIKAEKLLLAQNHRKNTILKYVSD